jgi:Tol biopolymer transport system component
MVGGELRKIHNGGYGAIVSPDGSRIAFLGNREIWLMGSNGEEPARLRAAPPGQAFSDLNWSPDGHWLAFRRTISQSGANILEAQVPGAGDSRKIFESPDLQGFRWLSSNVLVLNLWEGPDQPTSNLWQIHVNPKSMQVADKPYRLTNWSGFAVGDMSGSRDGQRLTITKQLDQSDVLIGDLADHDGILLHMRRLTSDERVDWPGGWTPDDKSLLFQSDRTGRMSIFRQQIDSTNPETLVADQNDNRGPIVSPDGQWILYLSWRGRVGQPKSGRVMRVLIDGGSAESILETKGLLSFVTSGYVLVPTTVGHPAFRCPSSAGAPCVLSEALQDEIVFSSFMPVPSTTRAEIFRVVAKHPNSLFWDLSPDGSRIAYGERGLHSLIRVRELRSGKTSDIALSEWPELYTVGWSADGKGLFATDFAPTGSSLLHVSLDGRVRVLYKAAKEVELPKASPDGHQLAFGEVVSTSNVWLIEGIPR